MGLIKINLLFSISDHRTFGPDVFNDADLQSENWYSAKIIREVQYI